MGERNGIPPERTLPLVFALSSLALVALALLAPDLALAGTEATFDSLEAKTKASVYGPLGKAAIYIASLGGALWAAVKGAWMMAGMGMGVGGLLYGTELVSSSGTFSALI